MEHLKHWINLKGLRLIPSLLWLQVTFLTCLVVYQFNSWLEDRNLPRESVCLCSQASPELHTHANSHLCIYTWECSNDQIWTHISLPPCSSSYVSDFGKWHLHPTHLTSQAHWTPSSFSPPHCQWWPSSFLSVSLKPFVSVPSLSSQRHCFILGLQSFVLWPTAGVS